MARQVPFFNIFQQAARQFNLDPALLMAVAKQESQFKANAVSHAGAQGVMQLMPGTAGDLGVENPFDPTESIMGGAAYLRQMLDTFGGDTELALAAYNAGPGNVRKAGNRIPNFSETQEYVPKVMGFAQEFGASGLGGMAPPTPEPKPGHTAARQTTPQRVMPNRPRERVQPVETSDVEPEAVPRATQERGREITPFEERLQEAQRAHPEALKFLTESEAPPELDSLNPIARSMIAREARKFGLEPQEAINKAWEMAREPAERVTPQAADRAQPRTTQRPQPTQTQRPSSTTQEAQRSRPGPRSSNPRQFFSDLSAARPPTLEDLGIGVGQRAETHQPTPPGEEPMLGSLFTGNEEAPRRETPIVDPIPHPQGGGEFPIPQRSSGSQRLRQVIMERLAQQRQRLTQGTG